ncbi:MAG: cytidine deaminase [Actinobacteria bacterium]|nr:cytidine deaminase [Actinomycetota bacterium]
MPDALEAEDAKLVALARGARGRVGAVSGAAVRDETGRTYAGADVVLPSLSISSLALAVAQAVAAGARGAEAAVVVGPDPTSDDIEVLRDLAGSGIALLVCSSDGAVRTRLTT